jgi:protein-tyrosine phosphatase
MYLGRVAVTRELSGRGLGLELLDSARRITAEAGFSFLRLNCPAENERLRRYYFDAGFDDLGEAELRGPSGERWTCSILEARLPRTATDMEG